MTRRFLIVSPARSGSTALRLAINVQAGALCHGEILGKNRILGLSNKVGKLSQIPGLTPQMRQDDPDGFLRLMLAQPDVPCQGFKALYSHFYLEQNAYLLNRVLADDPAVVVLWRRDLVRRFRSECLLRVEKELWRPKRFSRVSPEEVIADARVQMAMVAGIHAMLRGHGVRRVMDLDFEDLVAGPEATGRVLDFLGLDASRTRLVKDRRTRRNEASGPSVGIPPVFDAAELDHLRDVSLERALSEGGTGGGWWNAGSQPGQFSP